MSVSNKDLCNLSELLRSRTMGPKTYGTVILEPLGEPVDINSICAHYIGFFGFRPNNDIFFFLGTKMDGNGDIAYTYVFYLNEDYTYVQESELELLKPFVPNIAIKNSVGHLGIINVRCLFHPSLHLSMFLEAIDSTMGYGLITHIELIRYIETEMADLSVGPVQGCRLGHCDGSPNAEVIKTFEECAEEFNLSFAYCRLGVMIEKTDTALLKSNGHLIGIIVNRQANYVNHILLHPNQYSTSRHYAQIVEQINELYRNNTFSHFCTRICPSKFVTCYGHEVLKCWKLCLRMRPNVMLVARDDELEFLFGHEELGWIPRLQNYQATCILKPYRAGARPNISRPSVESRTTVCVKSTGDVARVIQTSSDSQTTQIIDPNDWKTNLSTWNDIVRKNRRIKDSLVPPVHILEPTSDLENKYLKELPSFEAALDLIRSICDRYAPTILFHFPICGADACDRLKRGARFLIYALENIYTSETVLIVADVMDKRWILLNPNNTEYKDKLQFELIARYLTGSFPELNGFLGEPISMSSSFHTEYPKLHLVMSLYVISRLFKYCIGLPSRIIYGEQEFRLYANNVITALQVENNNYNYDNGLIDDHGRLLGGAKRSLMFPIKYVVSSVVPKDLCMFCKKRGFNNLGRHYAAKHGQQAMLANRLQNEQRRSG